MKCSYPGYDPLKNVFFPCGQCQACRINRKKVWTTRMLFENQIHKNASFITLTYDNDNLPKTANGLPTLCKADHKNFMKRLRKELDKYNIKIRYYGCGEYGEKTWRPHYHYIIFGVDFRTPLFKQLLQEKWNKGHVFVGEQGVQKDCLSYVAGYLSKKLTSPKDDRLLGRAPEFSVQSIGIGRNMVDTIVSHMLKYGKHIIENTIQIQGKAHIIGRYIKNKVKEKLQKLNFNVNENKDFQINNQQLAIACYQKAPWYLQQNVANAWLSGTKLRYKDMIKFAEPLIDRGALDRIKTLARFSQIRRSKI